MDCNFNSFFCFFYILSFNILFFRNLNLGICFYFILFFFHCIKKYVDIKLMLDFA